MAGGRRPANYGAGTRHGTIGTSSTYFNSSIIGGGPTPGGPLNHYHPAPPSGSASSTSFHHRTLPPATYSSFSPTATIWSGPSVVSSNPTPSPSHPSSTSTASGSSALSGLAGNAGGFGSNGGVDISGGLATSANVNGNGADGSDIRKEMGYEMNKGGGIFGAALDQTIAQAANAAINNAINNFNTENRNQVEKRNAKREEEYLKEIEELRGMVRESDRVVKGMKEKMNEMESLLGQESGKRLYLEKKLNGQMKWKKETLHEIEELKEVVRNSRKGQQNQKEVKRMIAALEKDMWELRKEAQAANGSLKRNLDNVISDVGKVRDNVEKVNERNENLKSQIDGLSDGGNTKELARNLKNRLKRVEEQVTKMNKESKEDLLLDKNRLMSLIERVEGIETKIEKIKSLVACALRTDQKVEQVVKDNVSLITKHVCSAMRHYTAKKITDNNRVIDKVLKARVPEYSKYTPKVKDGKDGKDGSKTTRADQAWPKPGDESDSGEFVLVEERIESKDSSGRPTVKTRVTAKHAFNNDASKHVGEVDDNCNCGFCKARHVLEDAADGEEEEESFDDEEEGFATDEDDHLHCEHCGVTRVQL